MLQDPMSTVWHPLLSIFPNDEIIIFFVSRKWFSQSVSVAYFIIHVHRCPGIGINKSISTDTVVIAVLLHPKCFASFPRIPFPETIKLRIRGFFHAQKNSCRMRH